MLRLLFSFFFFQLSLLSFSQNNKEKCSIDTLTLNNKFINIHCNGALKFTIKRSNLEMKIRPFINTA